MNEVQIEQIVDNPDVNAKFSSKFTDKDAFEKFHSEGEDKLIVDDYGICNSCANYLNGLFENPNCNGCSKNPFYINCFSPIKGQ